MPIFSYFAVVGATLLALLLVVDARLPERGPLALNNEFSGLPAPSPPDPKAPSLAAAPAPAPDMTSALVVAAAPPSTAKTSRADRTAHAEAAHTEAARKKTKHVARRRPTPDDQVRRYAWWRDGDVQRGFNRGGGPFMFPY